MSMKSTLAHSLNKRNLIPFLIIPLLGMTTIPAPAQTQNLPQQKILYLPTAPKKIFTHILAKTSPTTTVPVLMYHYVRTVKNPDKDQLGYSLSVTPADFETQLSYLLNSGYHTITPENLYHALQGKQKLPNKPVILTFDDGYQDFYTTAFPILQKYEMKATVFVVPDFISEPDGRYMTWPELKELDDSGLVTIGSHTMRHVDLKTWPDPKWQITKSKAVLEKFLGHEVTAFAYPGGTFNEAVVEMVRQAGYALTFTTRYGIGHTYENRFTLSRVRVSGGLSLDKFIERLTGQFRVSRETHKHI